MEQGWIDSMHDVYSDKLAALCSHHFLLNSIVRIEIPKTQPRERIAVPDHIACHNIEPALSFAAEVDHWMQQLNANDMLDHHDISSSSDSLNEALTHASGAILPSRQYRARRPWISFSTLDLIERRDRARADGDFGLESNLSRQIKSQVKWDRARWLDNAIASGYWQAINSLHRKAKSRNFDALHGEGDYDDSRAKTLAQYFAKLQWAVRPTLAFPNELSKLHDFNIHCGQIMFEELREASSSMKRNKQCGADGIYAEFLHAISLPCSDASEWILIVPINMVE